jgi:hypothetical protein
VDIEYEVRDGGSPLFVHLACYTLWRQEAAALRRDAGDGVTPPVN